MSDRPTPWWGTQDISVKRRSKYPLRLNTSGEDFSDRTFYAQVREDTDSIDYTPTLLASFEVDMTDAADGLVLFTLSAEDTARLPDNCVYDILQVIDGETDPTPVISGSVWVYGAVTRVE